MKTIIIFTVACFAMLSYYDMIDVNLYTVLFVCIIAALLYKNNESVKEHLTDLEALGVLGNVYNSGNATLTNLTVTGDLTVKGTSKFTANNDIVIGANLLKNPSDASKGSMTGVWIHGDILGVGGSAFETANLIAREDCTFQKNVNIPGNVNVGNNLSVGGDADIRKHLDVNSAKLVSSANGPNHIRVYQSNGNYFAVDDNGMAISNGTKGQTTFTGDVKIKGLLGVNTDQTDAIGNDFIRVYKGNGAKGWYWYYNTTSAANDRDDKGGAAPRAYPF